MIPRCRACWGARVASKERTAHLLRQRDMLALMAQPAFRRFLLRVYEQSGIGEATYRSEDAHLRFAEGRRSLGFEIFRWCDEDTSSSDRTAIRAALAEDVQPPGDSDDYRNDHDDDPN